MRIIEIAPRENGAHNNHKFHGIIPKGWAVVPDDLKLENFPFGNATVEEIDGVMTVTKWEAGTMPEKKPAREREKFNAKEEIEQLKKENAEIKEVLSKLESTLKEHLKK